MNDAPTSALPVIVIGASVGAIEALSVVLPSLPAGYPFAVLIVVHIPPDSRSLLTEIFGPRCQIRVKEAEDKERLAPATIYFAPPDYHLLVEADYTISLSSDEPVRYSRPSIDVLFETAADAFGDDVTGVVLTGSNGDGAVGLRAIYDAGGKGLVQSPAEAAGKEMPLAALHACPETGSLPLLEISAALNALAAH
jgi:two-component system chemotaxis response regulator CheB